MQEVKLEDLKKRGGGVGNCGYDKGNNSQPAREPAKSKSGKCC